MQVSLAFAVFLRDVVDEFCDAWEVVPFVALENVATGVFDQVGRILLEHIDVFCQYWPRW